MFTHILILIALVFCKAENPTVCVTYQHITNLESANERNGNSTLYCNNNESVYIHNDAPSSSKVNQKGNVITPVGGDEENFPVYKNLSTKELVYKEFLGRTPFLCIINDTLSNINWKLLSEKREIGGFHCQRAIGTFAGREYNVWFTSEIPISSGPYKLWGLPGLILEAQSLDGKVKFLFSKIEISNNDSFQIAKPKIGTVYNSLAEYRKASDNQIEVAKRRIKANGSNVQVTPCNCDWRIEKDWD